MLRTRKTDDEIAQEKLTPQKVATLVAKKFYDRWDNQSARGYEPECWGRVDVVEQVYDYYEGNLNDAELEIAVNLACKILYMSENYARAAILKGLS